MRIDIDELARQCTIESGSYTIEQRALPDFRDGLKPVQRRILWAMHKMGVTPGGGFKKSARITGETMGKYHPHGDCLHGDTLVPLANGEVETIKNLTLSGGKHEVFVYDQEEDIIKIAEAHSFRIGQITTQIYTITFFNGFIRCTGNHPFLTSSGFWKKASEITEGEHLLGQTYPFNKDYPFNNTTQILIVENIQEVTTQSTEMFDFTVDRYENMLVKLEKSSDYVIIHNSSIYDAMAKMANSPEPTIHGQGNFGSYEDSPAAPRYTEAKLSKYAASVLLDPTYISVMKKVSNYDGEEQEPIILPSKLPNLLINGSSGIATGCSSCIPSFSKESVTELVLKVLKGAKATPDLCLSTLKFKFHYGGDCISPKKVLKSYFKTGKETLQFFPKVEETNSTLFIHSHSPYLDLTKFFEKAGQLKGIKRIVDRRGKGKFLIEVVFYDNDEGEKAHSKVKELLTTSMRCQTYITIRNEDETVSFKKSTIYGIVNNWVKWRIDLEGKVVKRLKSEEQRKLLLVEWMLFALLNKEVIIRALNSKNPSKFLQTKLDMSEEQAEFTLNLKVRNLARLEEESIRSKIKEHKKEIKFLTSELNRLPERIISQMEK